MVLKLFNEIKYFVCFNCFNILRWFVFFGVSIFLVNLNEIFDGLIFCFLMILSYVLCLGLNLVNLNKEWFMLKIKFL